MEPSAPDFPSALAAFQRGDLERARKLAEDELRVHPDFPELQHLLGLIECRSGRFSRGVEMLERAVKGRPQNPQFRVMLVRALTDAGRPLDALKAAPRAIPGQHGTSEADIALWIARAEAAIAAGALQSAVEAWRAIASARPSDPRSWVSLARTLLRMNSFAEAAEAYERALELQLSVEVIRELGMVHYRSTRFDSLAALLDRADANGIERSSLNFLWAARNLNEGKLKAASDFLRMGIPAADSAHWHRLKTKIADADGQFAEAFESAEAMNSSVPRLNEWRQQARIFRTEIRKSAQGMTRAWATSLNKLSPPARPTPGFILGFPRSGTTLLDTFLMGHPAISVVEEEGVLSASAEAAGPLVGLVDLPTQEFERIRDSYFQKLDDHVLPNFPGTIIDKAPLNMLFAPLIYALFGETPIIFAQRHPCDVVLSAYMQNFEANLGMASFFDLGDAADFYDAAMTLWTRSKEILPLKVHVVTYEKLIQDPAAELRAAIDFLGLDWDDRLLDHVQTAKKRGAILNTSYDQIIAPLNSTASGRWRRYEEQLEPVLPILLPWARRLGYSD